MALNIRTREQWGAVRTPFRRVAPSRRTEFFVHYDGGVPVTHLGDAIVQRIEKYHRARGYVAIGYNFVVDQQGNIYEGRGWDNVGAHCTNHNTTGIGVQVAIGGNQTPSEAALRSVRALYDEACRRFGRQLKKLGHRDGGSTACPGAKLYDWVKAGMPAGAGDPVKPVMPPTPGKSIAQLADEVLAGQHGSGDQRRASLGSMYDQVQAEVNRRLAGTSWGQPPAKKAPAKKAPAPSKSIGQLAQEVIDGKWGSGDERKRRLGRNYAAVQAEVNRRLSGGSAPARKSIATLAQEVIDGKWGNGSARIRRLRNAGYDAAAVQREVNRRL